MAKLENRTKTKAKHSITLGIPHAICWRGRQQRQKNTQSRLVSRVQLVGGIANKDVKKYMENFLQSPYKLDALQFASEVTFKGEVNLRTIKGDLRRLIKARKTLKLFEIAFMIMSFVVIFILPMYLIYLAVNKFGDWVNLLYLILIVVFYEWYESVLVNNEIYINIKKWLDFRIEVYQIISENLERQRRGNKNDI